MAVEHATKGPYVPLEGMLKYIANHRELKQEKSAGRPHAGAELHVRVAPKKNYENLFLLYRNI